jgi:uncharacterized protein YeaO (DUF488 family)
LKIDTQRAYEKPARTRDYRVLVDRIWPRGVRKEDARIDLWLKEIAPSTALRKWFAHDPAKWSEFKKRYFRELQAQPDAVRSLAQRAKKEHVTLVYGAKDEEHNNAVALKEFLLAAA